MRIEATDDLVLTEEQRTLLIMHSVLNVLNTLMYELRSLATLLNSKTSLTEAEKLLLDAARDLRRSDLAEQRVHTAGTFADRLETLVAEAVTRHKADSHDAEVSRALDNITSILDIFRIRAAELAEQSGTFHTWGEYRIPELADNFHHVFSTIEQTSRGGYRIVYNLAAQEANDYYVGLDITSFRGEVIRMPAALQDVMRDLLANARKYTAPGGRILAGLHEAREKLRCVVEDTGRGIPAEELSRVIKFGYRASNVQDRPTRGGGFGLTKAFYVTRSLGGRMAIESEPDIGTRIEIEIPAAPQPQAGQAEPPEHDAETSAPAG
ncbi:MAG: sensor histidine kinase [Spirochaetaceae bacterium]